MSIRSLPASRVLATASLAALFTASACGPVAGPWGSIGGEWKAFCGAYRQEGESCADVENCATGLYCTEVNTGTLGVCKPSIALGGECKLTQDCKDGLVCNAAAVFGSCFFQTCDANNVCTQGAASGAKCNGIGLECPKDQICAVASSAPGLCSTAPGLGGDCNFINGYFQCGPTLACQRVSQKCVTVPKAGEPCANVPLECAAGLVCLPSGDSNKPDTCGKPIAVGAHCDAGGLCAQGSHCDLGKLVCTKNRQVGDSCKNGNECGERPLDVHHGVDCVQGECVDTSVVGARCWPGIDNQCSNGLTCVPKES